MEKHIKKLNPTIIGYGILNIAFVTSGVLALYFLIIYNAPNYLTYLFSSLMITLRIPIFNYKYRELRNKMEISKIKLFKRLGLIAFVSGILAILFLIINKESSILSNIFVYPLLLLQFPEEIYRCKNWKK